MFLEQLAIGQFTFGEAAWAAQPALSWQTTVVGDPLTARSASRRRSCIGN